MIDSSHVYVLAALLFVLGFIGFMRQRNAILLLMCIELMINSANLVFVAAARQHGDANGALMPFFLIVVAAAEAAVGLSLVLVLYRKRGSLDVDVAKELNQ